MAKACAKDDLFDTGDARDVSSHRTGRWQTVEIDDASAYDYFDRNPLDVTVPPLKIDGPAATIKINASEDSDLPGEVTLQAKKSDGAVVLVLTTGNQSTTYAIR